MRTMVLSPGPLPKLERSASYFYLGLIALLSLYVLLGLTPSHYALWLRNIGVENWKPLLGQARDIRSDEWAILTPLFQSAVRGGFKTTNQFSAYQESLKTFWALPILDWSLIFKPQLWPFWMMSPAFAYAAYFGFLWLAFIAGYEIFLRQLGAKAWIAALGSVTLCFSHLVQVWWSSNAPTFALAPWPAVVLMLRLNPIIKATLLFWVTCVWIFALAYPPYLVSAAWAIGILVVAFRRDIITRANVIICAVVAFGVSVTFYLYFGEILQVMSNTIYPGRRVASGGGRADLDDIRARAAFYYNGRIQAVVGRL